MTPLNALKDIHQTPSITHQGTFTTFFPDDPVTAATSCPTPDGLDLRRLADSRSAQRFPYGNSNLTFERERLCGFLEISLSPMRPGSSANPRPPFAPVDSCSRFCFSCRWV